MPLIKSAIKRAKQAEVRRARRAPYKTHMKNVMRAFRDFVKEGKMDDAVKTLPGAFKAIDTAAKKGIIHHKNANNKKALLSRMLAKKAK